MFDNKERKAERLRTIVSEDLEITGSKYNLVLGGCIAYGLVMNALSVVFMKDLFLNIPFGLFIVCYFISCFVGTIISSKSNKPIMSFLGYNLIVLPIGGLLTICLTEYEGADILSAIVIVAIITTCMIIISTIKPNFFSGLGTTLFTCLLLGLLGEIIAILLGYSGSLFNWAFVILFTLYIGYDWYKAQEYPKTVDNAVDSAVDIYLDIINLFVRILSLLAKSDD